MPREMMTPMAQPIFNEGTVTPDPTRFKAPHPSDSQLYQQIQAMLTKDVVSFPTSRAANDALYTLQEAYGAHGAEVVKGITGSKKIVFHAAGDTGASNERKYPDEVRVCDQLAEDCHTSSAGEVPAFLFQLGDVVYDFGESTYYYDQFYDPFRNYPGPIFAIPGNHDSFIVPNTPAGSTPLEIFERNFCATQPTVTAEARSLHRTAMTQPGVYYTLDAPFVRIIGLFSNCAGGSGIDLERGETVERGTERATGFSGRATGADQEGEVRRGGAAGDASSGVHVRAFEESAGGGRESRKQPEHVERY